MDITYWKKHITGIGDEPEWMTVRIYSKKEVERIVDRCIRDWNLQAETSEDTISEEGRDDILNLALTFFDSAHFINGCIINAMLETEGY